MKPFKQSALIILSAAMVLLGGLNLTAFGDQRITSGADSIKGKTVVNSPKPMPAPQKGNRADHVSVPDLAGKTVAEAEKELKNTGLGIGKVRYTIAGNGKNGTIVRQKPSPNAKAAKGSEVDLWIVRTKSTAESRVSENKTFKTSPKNLRPSPKIIQQGDQVFMEFSDTVWDVTISDTRGNRLQQFKKGKRFDITESARETKAGRIRVTFKTSPDDKVNVPSPSPPPGNTGVDITHTADIDFSRYINTSALEKKHMKTETKEVLKDFIIPVDNTLIESNEPINNNVYVTLPLHNGLKAYSGEVGGPNDPIDLLAYTSGPHQHGSIITVQVTSGNVTITLYDPIPQADPLLENENDFWIALPQNRKLYFSVQPTGVGNAPYTILISRIDIVNPFESQQTWNNPGPINLGQEKTGALSPRFRGIDHEDWFIIQNLQNQRLRVTVTNAHLPLNDRVEISIVDPNSITFDPDKVTGTNNEAILETTFQYTDTWKIRVSLKLPAVSGGFGTGAIPQCFRKPYKIRVEAIP